METEPVTHMVGIIMTETHMKMRWFDIIGERAHTQTQTYAYIDIHSLELSNHLSESVY